MFELITPPAAEPFSLTDLKAAMRIDHGADDDLVMQLGITARRLVERRLGHAIAEQTWKLTHEGQPSGPLTLRPGRVGSVTAVEVAYGEGSPQAAGDWRLVRSEPQALVLSAPAFRNGEALRSVDVTFTAGRADLSETPFDLVRAIVMLAAHYYENREAVGRGRYVAMPQGVETILSGLREVRL